jgi:hypothetical protein
MTVVPPLGTGLSDCRSPAFDRRKGDDDNTLAPLALQFQALPAHLGDQLAALTAGLMSLVTFQQRSFCYSHDAGLPV